MERHLKIGLMIESLSGYGEKILTGISRYAGQKTNWRVAFFDAELRDLADFVGSWEGDGLICAAVTAEFAEAARSRQMPMVNVSSRSEYPAFVHVIGDEKEVGARAGAFLTERGFKNFAAVRRKDGARYANDRLEGFTRRVGEIGSTVDIFGLETEGREAIEKWLVSLPRPVAILGVTDRLAALVLETCEKRGLRVPEEVAVLGIGNYTQMCDLCSPTLSSLDLDMERRGYEAAQWLDRLMNGEPRPGAPILIKPNAVIERRSTDVYAFDDPDVASALRFIRDNAALSIKVGDVVKATNISRRSLEGRFNKLVGATLHDEIWKAHFDLATRMLTTSDLSLQEVAQRSGFRTASALVTLFRHRFGMTPRDYRIANRR